MRESLPRVIIIALLVAIVGVPILLRPSSAGQSTTDANAPRLVVYTPHNEQIRYEIEHAFNDWRINNGRPAVAFDWRTPGGTSDIRKSILSQYQALVGTDGGLDKGIGVDLFFGGGDYDHGKIASGIKDSNDNPMRIVDDPQIPQDLFAEAFPEQDIGGEPLYAIKSFSEDGGDIDVIAWAGVTLSSFGIAYNHDTLATLGLEEPRTWGDMANPALRGWIALADPGHSGSVSKTIETVLRREGWSEGWRDLRGIYANARYFATDAQRVPVDVSRGDAAMGMCIDFYGRYQTGMVGDDRMGYTDPVEDGRSMTATTADPITLLRGAPSAELAREFIAWLLTPDAQALWQRALSEADDGLVRPKKYELRRQPLRADLYTDQARASWVDRHLDPYATAVPFPDGTPGYFSMVAPITKAMAIEVHGELTQAWDALIRAEQSNHHNLDKMRTAFYAMPEELTLSWPDIELKRGWREIHYNPSHPRHAEVVAKLEAFSDQLGAIEDLEARQVRWRSFFQRNYREVVRLAAE